MAIAEAELQEQEVSKEIRVTIPNSLDPFLRYMASMTEYYYAKKNQLPADTFKLPPDVFITNMMNKIASTEVEPSLLANAFSVYDEQIQKGPQWMGEPASYKVTIGSKTFERINSLEEVPPTASIDLSSAVTSLVLTKMQEYYKITSSKERNNDFENESEGFYVWFFNSSEENKI